MKAGMSRKEIKLFLLLLQPPCRIWGKSGGSLTNGAAEIMKQNKS